MTHGWIAPTSYPTPFALVLRNGNTGGKRLSTRMAYITEAVAHNGKIVFYKGLIGTTKLTGWSKHPMRIEPSDIIKTWRSRPHITDIQRAKSRLPVFRTRETAHPNLDSIPIRNGDR